MSYELWEWLERVRDERNQAQVALQNGDDGPMRLWALRHGHALVNKCEELTGVLVRIEMRIYRAQLQLERSRNTVKDALRAPGGGS